MHCNHIVWPKMHPVLSFFPVLIKCCIFLLGFHRLYCDNLDPGSERYNKLAREISNRYNNHDSRSGSPEENPNLRQQPFNL